jgi:hypothetical protein
VLKKERDDWVSDTGIHLLSYCYEVYIKILNNPTSKISEPLILEE